MNIQTKLVIEQVLFNFLMYSIMLIGGLAAILVDMVGMLWHKDAYWYVSPITIGTLAAAGLCHFFVHYTANYLTLKGDIGIQQYELDRRQSSGSGMFVGYANFIILFVILAVTAHSIMNLSEFATAIQILARVMFLTIGLALFLYSPRAAKNAWEPNKS